MLEADIFSNLSPSVLGICVIILYPDVLDRFEPSLILVRPAGE